MKYKLIELKYFKLINKSKKIMQSIKDPEHDYNHIKDVVKYTKLILSKLDNKDINIDACIISAYYHDIGRSIQNENHELLSAKMLKEEMQSKNYDSKLIDTCYNAIVNHKWNMTPTTIEGKIIKDADKLGFIGKYRWKSCLKKGKKLTEIKKLLPILRDKILLLDVSKTIYDQEIIKFNKKYQGVIKCI